VSRCSGDLSGQTTSRGSSGEARSPGVGASGREPWNAELADVTWLMASPQELLEKKLNVARAVGMLVAGAVILAIDGGEQKWRIGGRNGAPAVYFAYLFVAVGLVWSIFAIKGLLQAQKETR
jgi:hypothetical protein